jgi:hypothetical protein
MVDDSSAPFSARNVSTQRQYPKRGDEERGGLPSEKILVSEGSEFALTVSELELVWRTCPPRLNHRPVRCSEEAMCLWTTNLNLLVEATAPNGPAASVPEKAENGSGFDSGQDAAGPSKKRVPEATPLWRLPLFFYAVIRAAALRPHPKAPYI